MSNNFNLKNYVKLLNKQNLIEDGTIKIDHQVTKTRETLCLILKNLQTNRKAKTKRIIIIIFLGTTVGFNNFKLL